jgi:hypothetical protein
MAMSTPAAPRSHDEYVDDVWLYECLSCQVAQVRYGPTGTSWIWAYRGLWRSKHVLFFRPAPWMIEGATLPVGEEIHDDLAAHALHLGRERAYYWAVVEAPLGVRLSAIVAELARRGRRLDDAVVLDLVARTRECIKSGPAGDTFVTWEGPLWLAPEFAECWAAEHPSHHGDEEWDVLVLEHAWALRAILSGAPGITTPLLGDVSPALGAIAEQASFESLASSGEAFFTSCAEIAGADRSAVGELAALARELFADVFARQRVIDPAR